MPNSEKYFGAGMHYPERFHDFVIANPICKREIPTITPKILNYA